MTKETVIQIDEGKYIIGVETLQKEADKPSAMARYLSQSAIVTNQNGSLTLTLMLEEHKTITGFQIENQAGEPVEAIDRQVNDETNKRFEMFKLNRLTTILHVRVQYEVEHEGNIMNGDEALRLLFDEESLEKVA